MLNHVTVIGRLGNYPEKRSTNSGKSVCTFSVAVDRDFKDKTTGEKQTDWLDITVWEDKADFVCKYFQKGSMIVVDGRLQSRKYTDRNGNNRTAIEIVAEKVYFAGGKNESSSQSQASSGYSNASYNAPDVALPDDDEFKVVEGFDDDLGF